MMPKVYVKDIDRMNLLGLFLMNILDKNLKEPEKYERVRKLNCSVVIKASRMEATLILQNGEISLERGAISKPTVVVEGSLDTLLKITLGQSIFRLFIKRKIKMRGNFFVLLRLLNIISI